MDAPGKKTGVGSHALLQDSLPLVPPRKVKEPPIYREAEAKLRVIGLQPTAGTYCLQLAEELGVGEWPPGVESFTCGVCANSNYRHIELNRGTPGWFQRRLLGGGGSPTHLGSEVECVSRALPKRYGRREYKCGPG